MFPDLAQLRRRIAARIGVLAASLPIRLAVAGVLVLLQLTAFTRASHTRLGLPFDLHPEEAPYFSDPDAPAFATPRQPHHWSRLAVSRFDAQHYIATAERGLTACPDHGEDEAYLQCGLGWLPAWGLTGGVVSTVTTLASDHALLLLAILAALALNFLWTSDLLVARFGRGATWATLVAVNAFPAGFYVVTPYSEGATLALGLAAFLALAKERYLIAAALAGAATALQPSSMAFALGIAAALATVAYRRRAEQRADWWRPLLGLPLCAWGQLVTLIGLQIAVGDWSAYLRARHVFNTPYHWSRLVDIGHYMRGLSGQDMDGAMLLAAFGIIALTAKSVVAKLVEPERIFVIVASVIALVLAIVTPPTYWGQTRLILSCPLVFLGLGALWKRYPVIFVLWLILSLAFYWHVDLCGYVSHGNKNVCPALGKSELVMPIDS